MILEYSYSETNSKFPKIYANTQHPNSNQAQLKMFRVETKSFILWIIDNTKYNTDK